MRDELIRLFDDYLARTPNQKEIDAHSQYIARHGLARFEALLADCDELYQITHYKVKTPKQPPKNIIVSKPKRVAICIAGHLRTFKTTFPKINEMLVEPLNADVFIHTWDTLGTQTYTLDHFGPAPSSATPIDVKEISSYLKVTDMLVENNERKTNTLDYPTQAYLYSSGQAQPSTKFSIKPPKTKHSGSAEPKFINSQLYSVYMANKLCNDYSAAHKQPYDLVIKLRPDIMPLGAFPLDHLTLQSKYITIPDHPVSNHGHPSCNVCRNRIHDGNHTADVCDIFAYGGQEEMKHYSSLFTKLPDLYGPMYKESLAVPHKFEMFKTYRTVNIWKDRMHHRVNCYYPERLFRQHLIGYRLINSTWATKIIR